MLIVLHSLTSTNPTCQRCPSPCHPFCPPMTWWSRSESGTLWLRVSWPQSAAEESTNKKNLQITRQESTNNASQNATCDVIPEVCANIMYSILSPKCGDASSICKTRITYVALIGHPILLTNLSPPIHFPLLRCRRETAVRTDFATAIVCPSVSTVTVMGHTMRCIGSPIVCHGQQSSDKKSERKTFPLRIHLVCPRFSPPPALTNTLSPQRHTFLYIPPFSRFMHCNCWTVYVVDTY